MIEGAPFRLLPTFAERIWGRRDLMPWYDDVETDALVGEAWLTGPECVVATGARRGDRLRQVAAEFPLLVKMLFPDDRLSVQVHPDDAQAKVLGLARGKTECWYVLEAEEGAKVACGLKPGVSVEDARAAVGAGTMEELMRWLPVSIGEMVFVDAGTVHAIGPKMTLLEVQQTCDVTYRLYDYGRPRELHLKEGLAVVKTETSAGKVQPKQMDGFIRLIETQYFVVDRFTGGAELEFEGPGCLVGLSGQGKVDGVEFGAGEAVVVGEGRAVVEGFGMEYVCCFEPGRATA